MRTLTASITAVLIVIGTWTPLAQAATQVQDNNIQILDSWYKTFLGRGADSDAYRSWLDQLNQGNYLGVESGILGSDEYFMRHGNTPESMIAGFYVDVLGRRPSIDEVQSWMSRLRQVGWDRTALATDFLNAAQNELALRNGQLPQVYQPTYIPPQRVVVRSYQYSSGPVWGYLHRDRDRDHRDRDHGHWPWYRH
jgi:hypothetical protein